MTKLSLPALDPESAPRREGSGYPAPVSRGGRGAQLACARSADDVRTRFEFGLRCALAHGAVAIRTHLDSLPPQERITWPLFCELRAAWAGRIDLQAVALVTPDEIRGPFGETLAEATSLMPHLRKKLA